MIYIILLLINDTPKQMRLLCMTLNTSIIVYISDYSRNNGRASGKPQQYNIISYYYFYIFMILFSFGKKF